MKRLLTIAIAAAVSVAVIAGGVSAEPRGTMKMAGSTTVLPLAQVWAETYMGKHPGVRISVSGGGTGTGISMLLSGSCDIANASREAKKSEVSTARSRNTKLVATKLAKDGLAIIVNSSNNMANITLDQLAAVYSGKISNWKQLGGSNREIVVVGRDTSSGTYGFFQDAVLKGGTYRKEMLSMPSNAAVAQAVSQSKDAIGYVGVAYADEAAAKGRVHILGLSRSKGQAAIKPTRATIDNATYPLFRYLYAYTLGAPRGLSAEFLKWATGPEGQSVVRQSGYEPLR